MPAERERGICGKCGQPWYMRNTTDGLVPVHDVPQKPWHIPTRSSDSYTPDENHVADERNDQVRVDSEPEDSFSYGGLDMWDPWKGAF